jgi:phenylacetate-CoA ligase
MNGTTGGMGGAPGESLFWPQERWRRLQSERLAAHLTHAAHSGLYRGRALPGAQEVANSTLEQILAQLPLTTKDQVNAAGREAWAVPPERAAEWVSTSGTTGKPLDVPLTASDLDRLARNEEAALALAGIGPGDLVVLAVAMDRLFVAGLAYWLGAARLGAARVRVGPQLASQPGMLRDLIARMDAGEGRVFVIAVPSFMTGVEAPIGGRPLAGIVAIGEPIRAAGGELNPLGNRLRERFGCPIMSTYASTETCTTFAEGPTCRGGHLHPELAIVEVLDEAWRAVSSGETGEVVVTPLGMEAFPLIRFRTGDMAALLTEPCPCGRTTPRIGPIVGRRQQLLKIRGTSVYPTAIIEALRALPEVRDCLVVAQEQDALSDRVEIYLALAGPVEVGVRRAVEGQLRGVLRVLPEIRYVGEAELRAMQQGGSTAAGAGATSRKLARFIDLRAQVPGHS